MTTSTPRELAKIYQFPVRTRPTVGTHHGETQLGVYPSAAPYAAVACGAGWYHEAAVQEAERSLKR